MDQNMVEILGEQEIQLTVNIYVKIIFYELRIKLKNIKVGTILT